MRNVEQHLTQYAAYHRDRRNIATHFVGVPLIVFSVVLALSQITIGITHLGWVGIAISSAYYIWLDRVLGFAMLLFLCLCGLLASLIAIQTNTGVALAIALLIFIGGWIIQFIGHKYEGMKPAFIDDMMGLLIGPLFVTAEVFFLLGKRNVLRNYIEARVGPTLAARDGQPIGPSNTIHSN
jgi:uncharacterized membrane protein YGL010W